MIGVTTADEYPLYTVRLRCRGIFSESYPWDLKSAERDRVSLEEDAVLDKNLFERQFGR